MHDPQGGLFLGDSQTLARFAQAFYRPRVSEWQNPENWQLAGGRDATQRATAVWQQALGEYRQPPLDPPVREQLEAYVSQRRAEIGDAEP